MGLGLGALEPCGFHHRYAQDILGLTGEVDMVYLVIGDGLIGEDALVYEGLQLCGLHTKVLEDAEGRILLLTDESKEQMIRADSVASGTHRFLTGVFNDEVEFVGNL